MDEPASALDPIATQRIEELIHTLKQHVHDRHRHAQHAAGRARLGHRRPSSGMGQLVECGRTEDVFTAPRERLTEDYVTGRFG